MSTPSATPDPLPLVSSPYAGTKIATGIHATMNAYWFGSNFHWAALLLIVLPEEVARLTPRNRADVLGLLLGLSALVALFVPLVVGALSDRSRHAWGRRRPFMMWGVIVNVIGLGVMAFGFERGAAAPPQEFDNAFQAIFTYPPLLIFFGGFLLVQFGNNVASGAFMGMIPDLVPEDQRGTASGWYALMTQVGTLFGALVLGILLAKSPDPIKYAVIGLVLLGSMLITVLKIREPRLEGHVPSIHWPTYVRSLWINPKIHPDFAWVWITRFLVVMGFEAVKPFIQYYLADVIGVPVADVAQTASLMLAAILVFSVGSAIGGGILSDRIGRKRIVYVANSALVGFTLLFVFCRNVPAALVVGALFGLAYGAYISVDYAMGTDVLPDKAHAGKEMAVWHVAMTLPQALASPGAGELIKGFGSTRIPGGGPDGVDWYRYTPQGYAAVFVAAAICFALGAIGLRNVKGVK